MIKTMKYAQIIAFAAGVSAFVGCQEPTIALKNRLPQDVKVTCPLDSTEFNPWFESKQATENGKVLPANSVAFVHDSNCNFYRWASQMFLWITSPNTSGKYEIGNTVMESPTFYTVQPDTNNNSNQGRKLVQNFMGGRLRVSSSIKQTGPNHLPVILDKNGRIYEVEKHGTANAMLSVKDAANKVVAVHHVEANNGGTTFFDSKNQPISNPKAIIKHTVNNNRIVHSFITAAGKNVFLDGAGNIIETETGQATNDVLMASNGSLVYYILFVNDVYAYFQAGVNKKLLDGSRFPTTKEERDNICKLARANGVTLKDSNALAMELKTSWVEAVNLPDDSESYIMTYAIIPTYKQVSPNGAWMLSGERLAKLALIGAHVVGSVAGHPEMVWATFEHQRNAPNAAYQYVNIHDSVITVPQDTGHRWLLSTNASDPSPNVTNQFWSETTDSGGVIGDTIIGTSSTMKPSNVLRTEPWGSAMDSVTNPEDKSSAASNSEIISINNAVYSLLKGKDVRKNYQLIGATWTNMGAGPIGQSYGYQTQNGVAIGTNVIANSTMETFFQAPTNSCFSCHFGSGSLHPDSLSHIFQYIVPIKLASVPPALK